MFHELSVQDTLKKLKATKNGLSLNEAKKRLRTYGPNRLAKRGESTSRVKIFINQWKNPLIIILLIAGAVSGFLGELTDMTIILITAGINAVIGFVQEDKASRALSNLRSLVTYKALVVRKGVKIQVPSEELVPGDILHLTAGDKVQADARIIHAASLQINEATLTGESVPVDKHTRKLKADTALADRKNMVFRGTTVASGETLVVVTATGQNTEIGKISTLVSATADELTPLQLQLAKLSRFIGGIIVIVAAFILALGLLVSSNQYNPLELFKTAVAVAVAAIPGGLVISLTVILAISMQHILKKKALVRKLVAAETLGSVSVICTDKTGTLTEGNMRVSRIITDDTDEMRTLTIAVLCNDATIQKGGAEGTWRVYGDTTETTLLEAGAQSGIFQQDVIKQNPRIDTIPFDSDRKYMATLHKADEKFMYAKGAPEVILKRSKYFVRSGVSLTLTNKKRTELTKKFQDLTDTGLRVLAVAEGEYTHERLHESDVTGLTFVGFIALADPVRSDVKETIATAQAAGIHVVMITGDHAGTARSIAAEIGLPATTHTIIEGAELESMSEAELADAIKSISIFARVDPKHKLSIVRAFQKRGDVVAMTGDGVNDAPALKGADIGVALGSGTDVAKEVSDMVLLNDSLTTIVAAIEEGRRIYQNIKKEVLYLMIGSFTEALLITATLIGRLPLALLPAQILWINIIQEAFPGMALAFDSGDTENMRDRPRPRSAPIMDRQMKVLLVIFTLVTNAVLFGLYLYFLRTTGNAALVRTLMFVGIGVDSLLYIYTIRSLRRPVWRINPLSNRYLTGAVLFGWVLLLSSIYVPPIAQLLETVPLTLGHWAVMIVFGLVTVAVIELFKALYFIKSKSNL